MVYRGPSKGCLKCRQRRVKCDQRQPTCYQCSRLGFVCPGYGHKLDVVLRNQTNAIIGRFEHSKSPSSNNKLQIEKKAPFSIPLELDYDAETHALTYLFNRHIPMLKANASTSHGHLDFLQPLYLKVAPDSALAAATSMIGVVLMAMWRKRKCGELEYATMNKAIRAISIDLKDPKKKLTDETLMAVLLAAQGDYLRCRRNGTGTSCNVHQAGAEALIRDRKDLNFQSPAGRALFTAARHNAVSFCIHKLQMPQDLSLWELTPEHKQICDSYTPATELDACGMVLIDLRDQMNKIHRSNNNEIDRMFLQFSFQQLLQRLKLWENMLPADWTMNRLGHNLVNYSSQHVCYVFASWQMALLETHLLIKEIDSWKEPSGLTDEDFATEVELIETTIASEYAILHNDPLHLAEIWSSSESKRFPSITAASVRDAPFGTKSLIHTLHRIEMALLRATRRLDLPPSICDYFSQILAWVSRECSIVKEAFPCIGPYYMDEFLAPRPKS